MSALSTKRIELIWDNKVLNLGDLEKLAAAAKQLGQATTEHTKANESAKKSQDETGDSAAASALKFGALAAAIGGYVAVLKTATVDAALYAARTETLSVVTDQLAKVNNLGRDAVRAQVGALKEQGITTQEALQTVNKMIFAQLDLAKATQLARVAQDAAVIAGVNSSEALNGIVHGITTRQPEVLRTYGIIVTFEQEFAKAARGLGRDLTEAEKVQVAMNAVLREGTKITGAYETAMLTTGKQLTSLKRYVDEAKNSIGEGLVPALGTAVGYMTTLSKYAQENSESFSKMAVGATALSVGLAAFKLTPGPPVLKGIAGLLAGGATYAAGTPDPIEFYRGQGETAIASFRRQQEKINEDLKKPGVRPEEAEALRKQFDSLKEYERNVVRMVAEQLAKVYLERGKGQMFEAERLAQGVDLGKGVKVSAGDVLGAIQATKDPGQATGALFNQQGYDASIQAALAEQAAKKAKDAKKKLDQLTYQMEEQFASEFDKLTRKEGEALKEIGVTPQLRSSVRELFNRQRMDLLFKVTNKGDGEPGVLPNRGAELIRSSFQQQLFQQQMDAVMSSVGLTGKFPDTGIPMKGDAAGAKEMYDRFWEDQRKAIDYQMRSLEREQAHREKMLQLLSGPSGELAAINKIHDTRIQHANELWALSQKTTEDEQRLYEAIDQARMNREEEIAALRKRQVEEIRQAAGSLFDAMSNGGEGVKGFFTGMVKLQEKTIFQNIAEMTMKGAYGRLTVPGQVSDQVDPRTGLPKLTWIGELLKGSAFGVKDSVLSANTMSTTLNTAATERLTGVLMSGMMTSGGAGGMAPGMIGMTADGVRGMAGVFGGNGGTFALPPAIAYNPISGEPIWTAGFPTGGATPKSSSFAKAVGYAAAGAGAAMGVYSGVNQGGPQGALTAGGSLAGGASAILALSGSSGPLAPILAGVGMGMSIGAMLLGDPKKRRSEEMDRMIRDRMYTEAAPISRDMDLAGNSLDYNFRGGLRSGPPIVQVNIQAMDAKSIVDRYDDIGEAVYMAAQRGHRMVSEFKEQLFPA